MSYNVKLETQQDVENMKVLIKRGYTLKSMQAKLKPVLEVGMVVDIFNHTLWVGWDVDRFDPHGLDVVITSQDALVKFTSKYKD